MTRTIANTISIILHPLLMPTLMFFILIRFLPDVFAPMNQRILLYLLLLVFLTTFVIPVLSLLGLRTSAVISNLRFEERKERRIPFVFITFFYVITTFLFIDKLQVNNILIIILISVSVQVALLTLITFFWKISVHGAGIGGMTGFMLALTYLHPSHDLMIPLIGLILLSGLVLSSRMYLNAHLPTEVYAGYLFGFSLSFLVLLIWT